MSDKFKVDELSKDEIIETLRAELKRKDLLLDRLKEENGILLKTSIRNAKRRLEEKND
ncbi:hypothetical protein K9L97_04400 [Candidatus Woesearchaeota archaeon]|nr:hypothetical protein [Candidatus Woesearchaeota archaeon]